MTALLTFLLSLCDPGLHASGLPRPVAVVERRVGAMGTWLTVEVEAPDRTTALWASERAIASIEAAEARLSTWIATSEVSRLNATPAGQPFALSSQLAADLALAMQVARDTGGAFDPTIGPLVRSWGLRTGGHRPSDEELEAARSASGHAHLEVTSRIAVRRHPGVVIDEGGFGKGVGIDDALAAIRAAGATSGFIDFGGQVASVDDRERYVDLADPRDRSRPVLRLRFAGGSVSTSGNSERRVISAGQPIGHVLDPRSGRPARDFGSMTVWAGGAALADALSTALFVLGPDEGLRWAGTRPGVEAVAIEVTGSGLRVLATEGLRERLAPLVPEIEIEFRDRRKGGTA